MPKQPHTFYVCSSCGAQSTRWHGRCFTCGEWNTLEPAQQTSTSGTSHLLTTPIESFSLASVSGKQLTRLTTSFSGVDTVLGGGLVPGSVILLGGEPGSGKSTLLLQYADAVAEKGLVFYIGGEESKEQISLRAKRLSLKYQENIHIFELNDITGFFEHVDSQKEKPLLIIVDSIQTVRDMTVESKPGTLSQVQMIVQQCVSFAKRSDIATVLVGHVTKEGNLAGPKTVEHLVDVVLYLEGDADRKVVSSVKNRFGSVHEIALFDFHEGLFKEKETRLQLLSQGSTEKQVGSVITVIKEGARFVPIDIQALVVRSYLQSPRRVITGYDFNRLLLLIAILDKYTSSKLYQYDVFINVAEGIKIHETAADLAVCAAILSSLHKKGMNQSMAIWGEVSLLGKIVEVPYHAQRVKEAKKYGINQCATAKEYSDIKQLLTRTLV